MYIDFIKNKYPDIPDIDRQAYIDRDKKALISIVQEKIAQNAEEIVERWYKLSDIGFLPQEEKFLDLLKEAEQLYSFGFYTGTIAVVGIACEEYCRYLVAKHKLADVKTQEKRIDKLYQDGVITSDIKDAIKQNAYIDNVEISRKLPDSIEIKVEERTATYMLTLGNAYVYINNQGYILEITSKKLEVPVLIGYNTPAEEIVEGSRLNETDLEKLNDVLKIMEATSSGDNNLSELITQIDISDKNNYILDLSSEKKKIYLGNVSDLSTKVLWINKILKDEEKNEGTIYLNVNLNVEEPYFREKV